MVWRQGKTGIWQANHRPTILITLTISALCGDLDNSGGTAVGAGLCLWGTLASHCGDGGANSWEIRLATVDVRVFCGPILGANFGSCGWNAYPSVACVGSAR